MLLLHIGLDWSVCSCLTDNMCCELWWLNLLHFSFSIHSTSVLWETSFVCDHFQFSCHSGSHIPCMVWLLMLEIFNMCTNVRASDCTLGLYERWKSLHRELIMGERSLVTMGSQTCISSALNLTLSLPCCYLAPVRFGTTFRFTWEVTQVCTRLQTVCIQGCVIKTFLLFQKRPVAAVKNIHVSFFYK